MQDILCRQNILDYHTLYYEQIVSEFFQNYLQIYLDICQRKINENNYKKKLEEDFEYMLKLSRNEVGEFIKEINEVNNEFIFKFLNELSKKEKSFAYF